MLALRTEEQEATPVSRLDRIIQTHLDFIVKVGTLLPKCVGAKAWSGEGTDQTFGETTCGKHA